MRRVAVGGEQRPAGDEPVARHLEQCAGGRRLVGRRERERRGTRRIAVGQGHERLGAAGRRPRARHSGPGRERRRALGVLAGGHQVAQRDVALDEVRRPAADPAAVDVVGRQQVAGAVVLAARAEHRAEDGAGDDRRGRVVEPGGELDALLRRRERRVEPAGLHEHPRPHPQRPLR